MTEVATAEAVGGGRMPMPLAHPFAGKRYLKMVRCRAECPLRFFARVVYSVLVYKRRDGAPVTARRIGEAAGIDAGRTVPKALEELETHG